MNVPDKARHDKDTAIKLLSRGLTEFGENLFDILEIRDLYEENCIRHLYQKLFYQLVILACIALEVEKVAFGGKVFRMEHGIY